MKHRKHIGSSLDDFLEEAAISKEVESMAACKLVALEFFEAMKQNQISKTELACRMKTSRAVVNRILDPNNTSMTFKTAARAAGALGCKLSVNIVKA